MPWIIYFYHLLLGYNPDIKPNQKKFTSLDQYMKSFPKDIAYILEKMRQTARQAAPTAVEASTYGISPLN